MIDNEFNILGLYDHNATSYRKVRDAFDEGKQIVSIVHATGTGKSFIILKYFSFVKIQKMYFPILMI